ncbi:MAG: hypothetical protein RSC41_03020, partial [Oscillospiraceae bacterium]
ILKTISRLSTLLPKRKQTLKQKIKILEQGSKKENFLQSSYNSMLTILNKTGANNKVKTYKLVCLFSGILGFLFAVILKSPLLVPVLSLGFGLLPMWLLKYKQYKYTIKMNDELSVALSTISSSYIRSDKFILAVKENMKYIKNPVKKAFEGFLDNCSVNPNIKSNIVKLRNEIDNKVFKLWCDNVIASQDDINQKYALNAVVEQFATEKSIFDELKTEMQNPIIYYISMLALAIAAFPISIALGNVLNIGDMTVIMFNSFKGQSLVTLFAISAFWGINKAINLSTSLD